MNNQHSRALTFDSRTNSDVDHPENEDDAKAVFGPTTRRQWSEIISKSSSSATQKKKNCRDKVRIGRRGAVRDRALFV